MRNNPSEHLYIAYTDTFWFEIEVDLILFEIMVLNVTNSGYGEGCNEGTVSLNTLEKIVSIWLECE